VSVIVDTSTADGEAGVAEAGETTTSNAKMAGTMDFNTG
jgi:hypothetical protein